MMESAIQKSQLEIEELERDIEEYNTLLKHTDRPNVKDVLSTAKQDAINKISSLEIKVKKLQDQSNNEPQRYYSELKEYGWDQSDKFVKLFIQLDGVQNLDESAVTTTFTANSMNLLVSNYNGKDYGLIVNNLLEPIDVEHSYRKLKTGMVAVYLKKVNEGKHWNFLTTIQKHLKENAENNWKPDPENPGDALMNIMKKMYQSGDSQTKQMIAKAWTESQQKLHKGDNMSMDDL